MKKIFQLFLLHWRHRHDFHLYENIWRRPDGVCVDDSGRRWDKYWQKIEPEDLTPGIGNP